MEPLNRFIEQNFGLSFLIGVMVVGSVVSGVVWITIWAVKFLSKNKETASRLDSLPCNHHSSRIEMHDSQLESNGRLLSEMKGQLDLLLKLAIDKNKVNIISIADNYSEKNSPRRLNENGEKLLNESGGAEFIEKYSDFFIARMEEQTPKTALDVEDLASSILLAHSNDDIFISLKNWIYNAPPREIKSVDGSVRMADVGLNDIVFVMSLPLRDKYLKRHPNIMG
ncbi:MAG: hypothetical protein HDS17_01995 [Bacteroides sp.]|nr:hypothetical protein [Bacteroides sp.]MDE5827588.1 hypothetical protein [Duncaniella sp.]